MISAFSFAPLAPGLQHKNKQPTMNCVPWMHKVFLITRTRATLAHISGQTGSVVLNWWLVAQQGRRPWVRWRGTALCHHHQGWIFLVVKATMGWWMVEIGHSAIWTRFHGMINLSRGPWLSVIWNPLSMYLLHNTGYLLQLDLPLFLSGLLLFALNATVDRIDSMEEGDGNNTCVW